MNIVIIPNLYDFLSSVCPIAFHCMDKKQNVFRAIQSVLQVWNKGVVSK